MLDSIYTLGQRKSYIKECMTIIMVKDWKGSTLNLKWIGDEIVNELERKLMSSTLQELNFGTQEKMDDRTT